MKYLAYVLIKPDEQEPPQEVEWTVVESVRKMGLEMPPVQRGWMANGRGGSTFSSKEFPGARPIWYWEVK